MLKAVPEPKYSAKFIDIYALLLSDEITYTPYLFFSTEAKAEAIASYIDLNGGNTLIEKERAMRLSDDRVFPLTHGKGSGGIKVDEDSIRNLKHPEQVSALLEILNGL